MFVHKLRRSPSGPSPDCLSFFLSVRFKGLIFHLPSQFSSCRTWAQTQIIPLLVIVLPSSAEANLPTPAHPPPIQLPILRQSIVRAQSIVLQLSSSSFLSTTHSSSTRLNRGPTDLSTVSSLLSLCDTFGYNIGTHTASLHDDGH